MIIDIDSLPEEGLEVTREYDFFSMDLMDENAVFLSPVTADVIIKKVGEEILIKGRIVTKMSFVCSRCLSPFEFPVDSKFDLIYFPEEMDLMKDQLENDDINQYYYYSRKIDLYEIVLEQLNLTFPIKPLCTPGCQGICPVCGNLVKNGVCSCSENESDSRLNKLKNILRDKR
jgi:uncharacterized protein